MSGWMSPWEFTGFDKDLDCEAMKLGVWVKIVYSFKSQGDLSLDLGYIGVMGRAQGGEDIINTGH